MAVTVSGASITFNDATVQNTAATAVNTTTVLAATAAASAGVIGSYSWLGSNGVTTTTAYNGTRAGSSLLPIGMYSYAIGCTITYILNANGGARAGTWRCMGHYQASSYGSATLWLRIS